MKSLTKLPPSRVWGYRYEIKNITCVDSEFLHRETTRPTLALLSDPRFAGATTEFRAAHKSLEGW